MILSVSRRTDIPAFYSEWFFNRIHAGFVMTRNPFNPSQVRRVEFAECDCAVFWTKDPAPMLPRLRELIFPYYFQFTLTPYDRVIEPGLPDKASLIRTFRALSQIVGPSRVIWRYDPIILNDTLTVDYHKAAFTSLCRALSGAAERVIISFVDPYPKLRTPLVRAVSDSEITVLAEFIGNTARAYGFAPTACCESVDLSPYGIAQAHCIDAELIRAVCGRPIPLRQDRSQRPGCGCAEAVDIGVYNTCRHGCVYCYANFSAASVRRNAARHHPDSPFLID